MKTLFCVVGCFLLAGSPLSAKEWAPPKALALFWSEMKPRWNPASDGTVWSESDTLKTREYCKKFAGKSRPDNLLPLMILDLKTNPSERRAFVYIWVAKYWPKSEVMSILNRYEKGDAMDRQIVNDFIAEIE